MDTNDFEPSCVVCAIDFEAPVDAVLDTALGIARRFDANLHLVHVWLPAVAMTPDGGILPAQSQLDAVSTALDQRLAELLESVRRRHPRTFAKLLAGTPAREIVRFAEANDADLIVTGTHGRHGLARLVEGSVAENVVRASSIPVLVVPLRPAEPAAEAVPLPVGALVSE